MSFVRTLILIGIATTMLSVACSSAAPLTSAELAGCTDAALEEGTIGGSQSLASIVVVALPDNAIAPEGTPTEEVEIVFDTAFREFYGIGVDEFRALRDDADAATVAGLGEPPGIGEMVSNEWFVERDILLMTLWNERHPASAGTFCDLVNSGDIATR